MLLFAGEELAERLERDRGRSLATLERATGRPGADLDALRRRCLLRVPRLYDEAETCTVVRAEGGQRYVVRFEVPYDGEPDCLFLGDGSPYDEDLVEVSGRMVVLSIPVPAAGADRDVGEAARRVIARHDGILAQVDSRMEAQADSISRVNAEIETALARAFAARDRQERLRSGVEVALDAARRAAAEDPGPGRDDAGEEDVGLARGYA